jgi:hypothetical protein
LTSAFGEARCVVFRPKRTSALFVDFDNIFLTLGEPFVNGVGKWLQWLEDGAVGDGRERRFVRRSVYWNAHFEGYRPAFEKAGFKAFLCRAEASRKIQALKSSADIWLTMDAVESSLTEKLDEVVLLSVDTDFVPLVNRLQQRNIRVVAAGDEDNPSFGIYSDHADAVISRNALTHACDYQRQKRAMFGLGGRPVAVAEPLRRPRGPDGGRAAYISPPPRHAPASPDSGAAGGGAATSTEELLDRVGVALEHLGMRTPHQPISRVALYRVLHSFPEFKQGVDQENRQWFGYGAAAAFLQALARRRDRLALTGPKHNLQIVYVGPVEPEES